MARTNTNVLPFAKDLDDLASRLTPHAFKALGDGKWHTADEMVMLVDGFSERTMRKVAERSDGEIISGQKGYRLTRFATATECRHAESWLQSQGRKMIARAIEIRNARARCR